LASSETSRKSISLGYFHAKYPAQASLQNTAEDIAPHQCELPHVAGSQSEALFTRTF
jgi:hypothetical protein